MAPKRKNKVNNVSKLEITNRKELLKELPFYDYKGSLVMFYGKFNNSLVDKHQPTKYELENLPSLYDVNLFDINTIILSWTRILARLKIF